MLAQNQIALGETYQFRAHDLIGSPLLQDPILVNP